MIDTIKVKSENVMDILSILNNYVRSFDWDQYSIEGEIYGFCCDTGNYYREDTLDNVSEIYWKLVNFGGDSKHEPNNHFAIEYDENERGLIDRTAPIMVAILDNDCGEYTNRYYTITPKKG